MNIFLTGTGFVARSIYPFLIQDGYKIYNFPKSKLNLTNFNSLREFFYNTKIDWIIHSASAGSRQSINKTPIITDIFSEILKMLEYLLFFKDYYDKLILFSSGSKYNEETNIDNRKEGEYYSIPSSDYSFSKFMISKRIKNENNIFDICPFNLFGNLEQNRFIAYCLKQYINKQDIEIYNDNYIDFFYINDLYLVIKEALSRPDFPKELNCVYKEKYKKSEIADFINCLTNYQVHINITSESNKNYTGNSEKLDSLNLPLKGLWAGIEENYKYLLKNYAG